MKLARFADYVLYITLVVIAWFGVISIININTVIGVVGGVIVSLYTLLLLVAIFAVLFAKSEQRTKIKRYNITEQEYYRYLELLEIRMFDFENKKDKMIHENSNNLAELRFIREELEIMKDQRTLLKNIKVTEI